MIDKTPEVITVKKSTRTLLTALLALVFCISIVMFLRQQWINSAASSSYSDALELASAKKPAEPQPPAPSEAEEVPEVQEYQWVVAPVEEEDPHIQTLAELDLEALREVNPDVVGWILIPDTVINYPLMQGEDNEYYLKRTWDGKKNVVGSIFLEHLSNPDLTDFNTIVYGHNMNNGSMFASLRKYRKQEYWEKHPYVYIRSDQGVYRYEIFSSYLAKVDSNTYGLAFPSEDSRFAFLNNALVNSVIQTGVKPETTDRVLTLSTCSGSGYSTRWVVHARLKMVQAPVS